LAARFSRYPARTSELHFVATGAKETGLGGARHLVHGMNWMKEATYFLNLSGLGSGPLGYTRGEGHLYVFPSDRELSGLAQREGRDADVRAVTYTGPPTDALIPLARGFRAITVMGLGAGAAPDRAYDAADTVAALDEDALERAAKFVERMIRGLGDEAVVVENEDMARAEAGD
jgi:hypothetical protein